VVVNAFNVPSTEDTGSESSESIETTWKSTAIRLGQTQFNWLNGNYENIRLTGHEGGVSCLYMDAGYLVSGSGVSHNLTFLCHVRNLTFVVIGNAADKQLIVWDISNASDVARLKGHSEGITCVKMSRSTGLVISGSLDRTVRVWNLKTLQVGGDMNAECDVVQHDDAVLCLQYHSELHRVASGAGSVLATATHVCHTSGLTRINVPVDEQVMHVFGFGTRGIAPR
jgi:hypothetical protein